MKRVLAVTYGAGHVNMVLPVVQELRRQPALDVDVLGLTTAAPVLKAAGIPTMGFADLITEDDGEAIQIGRRLAEGNSSGLVPYDETVAYLGLNYRDLEHRLGPSKAAALFLRQARQAFLPLTVMERLIGRLKPDLVLATNSPRAERAALIVASQQGIPSVCIVGLFAKQEVRWIGQPGFSSRICVLAEPVRQSFLNAGRTPDEIVVTGNPAFDYLGAASSRTAARLRRERGWAGKKVLLWASQNEPARHPFTGDPGDPSLPRRIDAALFELLDRHPDWHIVLRPHPNESVTFNSLPNQVSLSSAEENLAILLHAVDAVLTMTSTVGLQGVLIGKPLVAVNMSVFRSDAPYAEMGMAIGVDDLTALEDALTVAFSGQWYPSTDLPKIGRAVENVVRVVDTLLNA